MVVATVGTELLSSLESSPPPIAWKPTSRKTTPRNSSTITMARRGSPEESGTRSFIGTTLSGRASDRKAGPSTAQIR